MQMEHDAQLRLHRTTPTKRFSNDCDIGAKRCSRALASFLSPQKVLSWHLCYWKNVLKGTGGTTAFL